MLLCQLHHRPADNSPVWQAPPQGLALYIDAIVGYVVLDARTLSFEDNPLEQDPRVGERSDNLQEFLIYCEARG